MNAIQCHAFNLVTDVQEMQENAQSRDQEVLEMVKALSDSSSSGRTSPVRTVTILHAHADILTDQQDLF
jgi:hypothetical protein